MLRNLHEQLPNFWTRCLRIVTGIIFTHLRYSPSDPNLIAGAKYGFGTSLRTVAKSTVPRAGCFFLLSSLWRFCLHSFFGPGR